MKINISRVKITKHAFTPCVFLNRSEETGRIIKILRKNKMARTARHNNSWQPKQLYCWKMFVYYKWKNSEHVCLTYSLRVLPQIGRKQKKYWGFNEKQVLIVQMMMRAFHLHSASAEIVRNKQKNHWKVYKKTHF